MTMSKYFICCEKCFETIGKHNTRAAKLWMDLCAMKLETNDILRFKTPDFPELRVLERQGFLTSTDEENCIAVKINGHMNSITGEHFFCVQDGLHA
jgi:hypothetical protein